MSIIKSLFFFLLFSLMLSCSQQSIIGKYSDASPESKIRFAGKELTLNSDSTFVLNEWTDSYSTQRDENGSIDCKDQLGKGFGQYKVRKDSLELYFENNDFISAMVTINEIAGFAGMLYTIKINLKDERNNPLEMSTIIIDGKNNTTVKSGFTNKEGNVSFSVNESEKPKSIRINNFGAEDLIIDIEKNKSKANMKYEIKRCFGFYKKDSKIKLWYKLKGNRLFYKKKDGKIVVLKRVIL